MQSCSFKLICLLTLIAFRQCSSHSVKLAECIDSKAIICSSTFSIRGKRNKMEDTWILSENSQFAGVFDGHGGSEVATYARETFFSNFLGLMTETKPWDADVVARGMRCASIKLDSEILQINRWKHQGSTLAAVYLSSTDNNEKSLGHSTYFNRKLSITTINIGDSRIVLSHYGQSKDLTIDHKPNSKSERKRIYKLGGIVKWHGLFKDRKPIPKTGVYRVNHNLSLSRAIGKYV